jgi:hypothetical protein
MLPPSFDSTGLVKKKMTSLTDKTLVTLFSNATYDPIEGDDKAIIAEIIERMNTRRSSCIEGVEYFK